MYRSFSRVSYFSNSALIHSPLLNFIVTSHVISSPPLTKGLRREWLDVSFTWNTTPLSNKNLKFLKFLKFPSVKAPLFCWFQAEKLEWQTYQMDYCAHEKNLLHCSKKYKNLKNQYGVFSNRSLNLILAKFL